MAVGQSFISWSRSAYQAGWGLTGVQLFWSTALDGTGLGWSCSCPGAGARHSTQTLRSVRSNGSTHGDLPFTLSCTRSTSRDAGAAEHASSQPLQLWKVSPQLSNPWAIYPNSQRQQERGWSPQPPVGLSQARALLELLFTPSPAATRTSGDGPAPWEPSPPEPSQNPPLALSGVKMRRGKEGGGRTPGWARGPEQGAEKKNKTSYSQSSKSSCKSTKYKGIPTNKKQKRDTKGLVSEGRRQPRLSRPPAGPTYRPSWNGHGRGGGAGGHREEPRVLPAAGSAPKRHRVKDQRLPGVKRALSVGGGRQRAGGTGGDSGGRPRWRRVRAAWEGARCAGNRGGRGAAAAGTAMIGLGRVSGARWRRCPPGHGSEGAESLPSRGKCWAAGGKVGAEWGAG